MDNTINNLLESEVLSEEVKASLQEAFEKKLNEARQEIRESVEREVRQELSEKYDHDKGVLVEAMDKMLTESIRKEIEEFVQDRKALSEERVKLSQAIREARLEYKNKTSEHAKVLENFILQNLSTELKEFSNDRLAISEQRVKLAKSIAESKKLYKQEVAEHMKILQKFMVEQLSKELKEFEIDRRALHEENEKIAKSLREHRVYLNEQFNNRIKKIEGFVVKQLSTELNEFQEDKRQLVEAKVKMIAEGKSKLDETRRDFIKRASSLVEQTIEENLRKEIGQFKDDIKVARRNHFGRKIFEAFYAEFMTSYLSEGTTTKKLMKKLNETQKALEEKTNKITEQARIVESAERKARFAEERASRVQILNQLLTPLSRDKREIMEDILSNVETKKLAESFRKHLPIVLNETSVKASTRKNLTENANAKTKQTVTVTGDRKNYIAERVSEEPDTQTAELIEIRRLAGLN